MLPSTIPLKFFGALVLLQVSQIENLLLTYPLLNIGPVRLPEVFLQHFPNR